MRLRTADGAASFSLFLVALSLSALLAVAPLPASAAWGPPSTGSDGFSLERHHFVLNGLGRVPGQWGELEVPENRNDPGSRRIKVMFGRIPGRPADSGTAIFFIAGGPGASGIGAFAGNARWLLPLRRHGDLVLVEQRGTGFSRPRLDCAERWNLPIDAPLKRDRFVEAARQRFAACRRAWQAEGVDLAGYNTVAYAEDIVAVADALGYRRFAVIAFSYGTQIALELLRSHSQRLSRAVLLGVMGPSDSLRNPMDHDAVLARAAELLEADEASRVYPDLMVSTVEAIEKLRRRPVRVSIPGADDGELVEFVFDELAYRRQMVTRLGIRDELAKLPRFNQALIDDSDREWLHSELRNRLRGLLWMRTGPLAMRSAAQHYATVCAAADPTPRDRVPSDCILGHTFHPALPEACDAWQVPNLGDAFRQAPRSDVPVLMFSAELDTKTPMNQAQRLLPYLSDVRHVVLMNAFFSGDEVNGSPIMLGPIDFSMPSQHSTPCAEGNCSPRRVSSPFAGHDYPTPAPGQ